MQSAATISAPIAFSSVTLNLRAAITSGSRSTRTARAAPRDSASSPSAPLPANRSRQLAPSIQGCSQLKSVSRTRSGVGRRPSLSATRSRRLRQLPPMMRSRPGPAGRLPEGTFNDHPCTWAGRCRPVHGAATAAPRRRGTHSEPDTAAWRGPPHRTGVFGDRQSCALLSVLCAVEPFPRNGSKPTDPRARTQTPSGRVADIGR